MPRCRVESCSVHVTRRLLWSFSPLPPEPARTYALSFAAIPLAQRSNDCGQIGAVPPSPPLLTPLPLPLPLPCLQVQTSPSGSVAPAFPLQFTSIRLQVACGECHSVALTSDGRVWTWGGAGFGQLGRGKGGKGGMAAVKFDAGDCFCFRIAAGAHHTLAAMQGAAKHERTQCRCKL